jgi:GntR family transcriptional regulator, transcriptional repressor for pyruvate dehydrogenase complex
MFPVRHSPQDQTSQPALSDRMARDLLDEIVGNRLEPGHKLPSERELGEQFGVSRTVVREAIRSLAAKGVVEVRTGRAPRVAAVDPATAGEALGLFIRGRRLDYDLVHEVRLLLEVQVAALAAELATDADIEEIASAHARMERDRGDVQAAIRADLDFHRAIAQATHNDLYPLLLNSIGDSLVAVYNENLESGYAEQALAEHWRILASISAHDVEAARGAMAAHLEGVAQNLYSRRLRDRRASPA